MRDGDEPLTITSIASLSDGDEVRIAGRVRAIDATALASQISRTLCVYWDVRDGLDDRPESTDAQSFWIEDATGRVLVLAGTMDVDARAERRKTVLDSVANDLVAIENRLRDIKDALSSNAGAAAAALHRERKQLAKVATLLCAIRAQARNRVHGNRGTLASQSAWIKANAGLVTKGAIGAASTQLMVERWETVLCDGDVVEASGVVTFVPAPPEAVHGAGYRTMASVASLRGVRIVGKGVNAPPSAEERARDDDREWRKSRRRDRRRDRGRTTVKNVLAACGVVGAIVIAYLAAR